VSLPPPGPSPGSVARGVRFRPLRRLFAGAIAVVLLDLCARVVLLFGGRLLQVPVPPYRLAPLPVAAATPSDPPYAVFDADIGWTLAPHGRSLDGSARTNGAAIRSDREYELEPGRGVLRIAAFGDSFTHCDEVPTAATWPALLESWGEGLEVLNFGVPGYGTDQSLLRYRRDGRRFSPSVVLVGLLLENVGRNVNRFRPFWDPRTGLVRTKPRFVLDGDRLDLLPNPFSSEEEYRAAFGRGGFLERVGAGDDWYEAHPTAWNLHHPLHLSALARLALLVGDLDAKRIPRLYAHTEEPPFRITEKILETFVREATADGAERAVVVFFPMRRDLERMWGSERKYWSPMLDRLAAAGIETIDLADGFSRHARPEDLDTLFAPNAHYSPAGNRLVARVLAEALSAHYPRHVHGPAR